MSRAKSVFLMFILMLFISGIVVFPEMLLADCELSEARSRFYAAIEDEKQIKPAIECFEKLQTEVKINPGRVQVYLGALEALKGKHATWPHSKLKGVLKGLEIMDQGIEESPNDIEALFIHSSTCYHLPFFFKRQDQAQQHFERIVHLLPEHYEDYSLALIINVIEFLELNANLNHEEKNKLKDFKNIILDE